MGYSNDETLGECWSQLQALNDVAKVFKLEALKLQYAFDDQETLKVFLEIAANWKLSKIASNCLSEITVKCLDETFQISLKLEEN